MLNRFLYFSRFFLLIYSIYIIYPLFNQDHGDVISLLPGNLGQDGQQ